MALMSYDGYPLNRKYIHTEMDHYIPSKTHYISSIRVYSVFQSIQIYIYNFHHFLGIYYYHQNIQYSYSLLILHISYKNDGIVNIQIILSHNIQIRNSIYDFIVIDSMRIDMLDNLLQYLHYKYYKNNDTFYNHD